MKVDGLAEVQQKLLDLGNKEAKRVTRKALRAGGKITKAEMCSLAPTKSGNMKGNIKVRAAKRKKGTLGIIVGMGKSWFSGAAFYAGFVVFGHKTGKRGSTNRHQVEANNFVWKAYENSRQPALNEMVDTYKELTED